MYATPSPSEPPVHTIGLLLPVTGLLPADGTLYSRYEVGLPDAAVKATLTVRLLLLPMVATTLVGCPGMAAAGASKHASERARLRGGRRALLGLSAGLRAQAW